MGMEQLDLVVGEEATDLGLDVRIVTSGPVSAALLSSTDDGCDTVRGSDC